MSSGILSKQFSPLDKQRERELNVDMEITELMENPPEQEKEEYKAMAEDVLRTADQIIEEYNLSKEPHGANFWWYFHGENSYAAQALRETAKSGRTQRGGRIIIDFGSLDTEPNLEAHYGDMEHIEHNLTIDMARRLGFLRGEDTRGEYEHSLKPFRVRLDQDGLFENRQPKLTKLTITHK